jgi:tRNA(Ile)-lysidine synthase
MRDGYLIRPLLGCTHQQVEAFCSDRGVAWREDASNRDLRHRRNRVRSQLIPVIRAELCRDVLEKVGRLCELLRDDRDFLAQCARDLLTEALCERRPNGVELDGHALLRAHPAIARRALRDAIASVSGNRHNISLAHIRQCFALVAAPGGAREVPLPGVWCRIGPCGRILIASGNGLNSLDEEARSPGPRYRLSVPGRTGIPELGLEISASICAAHPSLTRPGSGWHAALDADQAGDALWVRRPRRGDRFRPLGLGGSKKLSDLFTDRKVPREKRPDTPVVESDSHILWVIGHQIDDRVRLTGESRRVLHLSARSATSITGGKDDDECAHSPG